MQKNPRKKLPQTNKRDAPLPITNKEGGQKGTNERFEFEKKHKTYFQNSFEGPNQYWKASWEVVSMLSRVLASARRLVARRRTNRKQPKKRISSSFFLQKLRFDHTFISHLSFGNESPRPETHKSKTHRVAGFGSKEDSVLLACPKPWLPFSQHGHLMGLDGKVEFFAIFFISSFRGNASRTCFVPDMLICSLRTFWYVYFNGLSLNKKVVCSGAPQDLNRVLLLERKIASRCATRTAYPRPSVALPRSFSEVFIILREKEIIQLARGKGC